MSNNSNTIRFCLLVLLIASCAAPDIVTELPPALPAAKIVRYPEPADLSKYFLELTSIPKFSPNSTDLFQIDLRSRDLTEIDMTTSLADLRYADFDTKTEWPAEDKMPTGFDWQAIMETGKDPGLGIRALHNQGIAGRGIGIAIIDQTLLVDHIEYKDRIRLYEETDDITREWLEPQMHGPAVASITAGRTVGVAPQADLYFIATAMCSQGTYETNDFACLAKSIRRIIDINEGLPADRKIRVLSISVGWGPESKGYEEVTAAVNDASAAGIFVLHVSFFQADGLKFLGIGRDLLADPNDFRSFRPAFAWAQIFHNRDIPPNTLLIPMDARTTASPTGTEDYVFYALGGMSWTVPYLAGMYALAAQVKPEITPDEFWQTALDTGRTIQIGHNGKDYQFGVILDPQALIEAVKNR